MSLMIKQKLPLFTFVFFLLAPGLALAQADAPPVDRMTVEIWPDFDQPAVLVLVTGFFAEGAPNPTEVTLPLPEGAEIHVVAIFTEDDVLTDQGVTYTSDGETVSFSTPGTGFRLEYYMPYEVQGSQRSFTYTWLADIPVERLSLAVQEPLAAASMTVKPAPAAVAEEKGLTYYSLPPQPVPANTPYSVEVTYTMPSPQLTANNRPPADTAVTTPAPAPSASFASKVNWPLALVGVGLLLMLVAVVWKITSGRRPNKKRLANRPRRRAGAGRKTKSGAKYCHECGRPVQPDDKFCRACGTAVKK